MVGKCGRYKIPALLECRAGIKAYLRRMMGKDMTNAEAIRHSAINIMGTYAKPSTVSVERAPRTVQLPWDLASALASFEEDHAEHSLRLS